jgi:endonuclease/exonuclease/phosphatase family metal-dependent hydrolase
MKLKVLTQNMWLFLFPISIDHKKRIRRLATKINELKPEFIALQEFFYKNDINYLLKQIDNYYFIHEVGLTNKSGLLTLTKHKPGNINFINFDKNELNFPENLTSKGLLITEFKIKNKKFKFINTHFNFHKNNVLRKKYTKNCFNKLINLNLNDLTFIAGDFNMFPDELKKYTKNLFLIENEKITWDKKSKYIKYFTIKNLLKQNAKLDYLFSNKKMKFKSQTIRNDISDHYGIFTEVEI